MNRVGPNELADFLASHEDVIVVDVREPFEHEICALPVGDAEHVLIPMASLPMGIEEHVPDKARTVLLYCHHGVRSFHAGAFLDHLGYEAVHDLEGGIDGYSIDADPSVPRY